MTGVLVAEPEAHGDGQVHTVRSPREQADMGRLGLWLFIASEGFLFTAFIAARFYLWERSPRPEDLNQPLGLALAVVLLASSYTAYRSEVMWRFGDRFRSVQLLRITILLGFAFLAGVVYEWAEGFAHIPSESVYGTLFYSITGFHAFHVLTGILALYFATRMAMSGALDKPESWAVEGVVKYWHFVDVVWVFIYPVLYLID